MELKAARTAYSRGYRFSANCFNLETADRKGYTANDDWMDGYMDAACGDPKWYRFNQRHNL